MSQSKNGFLSIYFCGSEDCLPGHSYGPAIRPHYLLHIVTEGRGSFTRNDTTYDLKKGDAFLIVPLESTFYQADQKDPWSYTWIGFDGPAAESLLSGTCFANGCVYHAQTPASENSTFFTQVQQLLTTWLRMGRDSYSLLGQFLEILDYMRSEQIAASERYADLYLQKAKDYIQNNYSYPIRVTDIAQAVGIDRTYLYRLFMENEQVSPKQYLLRIRLSTSLKLLQTTSYSITEIAFYCGFTDSAAFCNQFKAYFKETPGNFRKRREFDRPPFQIC